MHANARPVPPGRVVLLGARGFVGRAVQDELRIRGANVLALVSSDVDLASSEAAKVLGPRLRSDDAVVMLAAVTPEKGRDSRAMAANLAMMQAVCDAVSIAGCAHLIYISSDGVYGSAHGLVGDETVPAPADLYGAMHLSREIMARSLPETPVAILRSTMIYGADDPYNSYGPTRFRRAARLHGRIALFGCGEEVRDYVYIRDAARLVVECLWHRSSGTLNVATGISTSFTQVARWVVQHFSTPIEIVAEPRAIHFRHRHYDITPLIKAFPAFRFLPLKEGLAMAHTQEPAPHG